MFYVFYHYFICYLSFLFGINNRYRIAFRQLVQLKTFRISKASFNSPKAMLGLITKRVFADLLKNNKPVSYPPANTCIYNDNYDKWTVDYLNKNGVNTESVIFIETNKLSINYSFPEKIIYLISLCFILILTLPVLLFRPPAIYGLHISVLHEHVKIFSNISKNKIQDFYDFFNYESGSSFLNILLTKKGIKNYFITSPTPLYEVYSDCVCDTFLSTSPYHSDEIEYKKKHPEYPMNFICNNIVHWPYNEFDDKLELNTGNHPENKKKIGLYVSGVWWRNKEQHQQFAQGFFESEFALLKDMKKFVQQHPEFELWLFLHPRERKTEEQLQEALAFYHSVFEDTEFKLMDFSKPTKSQFSLCDISISVSSNTTYERLYGGFKSVFAPYQLPLFPHKGNALEFICARNYNMLEEKILQFDTLTDDEFFNISGLKKYHHEYCRFDSNKKLNSEPLAV